MRHAPVSDTSPQMSGARVLGDALWIAAPQRQHVERDLLHHLTIDRHDDTTAHRETVGLADAPCKGQVLRCARLQLLVHKPYLGLAQHVGDDQLNRRFVLKAIHEQLAITAAATPPMPYRLLKLAEARW